MSSIPIEQQRHIFYELRAFDRMSQYCRNSTNPPYRKDPPQGSYSVQDPEEVIKRLKTFRPQNSQLTWTLYLPFNFHRKNSFNLWKSFFLSFKRPYTCPSQDQDPHMSSLDKILSTGILNIFNLSPVDERNLSSLLWISDLLYVFSEIFNLEKISYSSPMDRIALKSPLWTEDLLQVLSGSRISYICIIYRKPLKGPL